MCLNKFMGQNGVVKREKKDITWLGIQDFSISIDSSRETYSLLPPRSRIKYFSLEISALKGLSTKDNVFCLG